MPYIKHSHNDQKPKTKPKEKQESVKLTKEERALLAKHNAEQAKLQKELKKQTAQKQKELDKKEQARQKELAKESSAPVIWEYGQEADLTIGEKKISNVAKIILIILVLGLIAAGVFGYLHRDYVLDYIRSPEVVLTTDKVDLEVGSKFDYKNYLSAEEYLDRYEITFPKNSDVDTSKLGTYTVEYKLKSLATENISTLVVNVVDTTAPVLKLKQTVLKLTRGEETKKFDAEKYIESVTDNYDKESDIDLQYTKTLDWSKDEVEVTYTAKDTSGNISTEKLTIVVNEPEKEPEVVYVETPKETPTNNGTNQGGDTPTTNTPPENNYTPPATTTTPPSGSPYINGVHDVTVKVGSDFSAMVNQLISGVQSSGYVSVDYSGVNLTSAGRYTATFSSDDGVTKTATVTVVD